MLKQFKTLLYISIPIFLLMLLQTGCKKKDVFPGQQLPQITSLSPASAIAGTPLVIKGVNLKDVQQVRFGTADAAGFNASSNTDTAIHVVVPDSLPLGPMYVQVYLADGKGYASFQFTVLLTPPVPKIDSVSPVSALPGASVVISGINFALVTSVKFGGVQASFGPTLDTNHKIQATVPLTAVAGNQYITVTNPNGLDSIPFNVDFSPVINSFTPDKAKEGDVVTLSGVRFTGSTSVKLGSLETTYTVVNDSTITFPVPTGAVTAAVTVTTPFGSGTSATSLVVDVAGFKLIIYDDALQAGFVPYSGWNGTDDVNNTSTVETGAKSVKIDYVGGYGSPLQWGGANIDLTGYTSFKISIFGGAGTTGKKVKIVFSHDDSHGKELVLTEGVWTDYVIPISDITPLTNLNELWVQEFSGSDEEIFVDNIGLN